MSLKVRILLVEDDDNLGYILKEYLKVHEFEVNWVKDGVQGLDTFEESSFDLCILDVMMPKMDGFTLAEKIKRRSPEVPLIFLTAKALKIDKLKGFKAGADDYIVKPVDEEELIARINAIVKRSGLHRQANQSIIYQIGQYSFDYPNQTLVFKGEKQTITTKEAEILKQLCLRKGQILDRQTTLKEIWGESDYFNRRSMDVFISKLRKYLSQDPEVKITNVHGKGFVLEDQ
ncbi:two-component system response regulator [Roseivirga sp. 4D4]|uniref:response regulator transcription factor n=1 Tax=Roseivirga sp. 4D4 TaxID=1889784 RepID=UPI000853953F|nr:response regulator transcription factor [Roseivirga sp. 4D4]OEK00293.1 two-component system response regulator [Roseivirga sp. 4D4]